MNECLNIPKFKRRHDVLLYANGTLVSMSSSSQRCILASEDDLTPAFTNATLMHL